MTDQALERPGAHGRWLLVGDRHALEKAARSFGQRPPGDQDVDHRGRGPTARGRPGRTRRSAAPSSSTLLRIRSISSSLAECESARFRASPRARSIFCGLVPGDRLVVRAAGIGPRGPPVARVVGLAVVEPAERREREPAGGVVVGFVELA